MQWTRGDSNSQTLRYALLRRTRIPIPPRVHVRQSIIRTILLTYEAHASSLQEQSTYSIPTGSVHLVDGNTVSQGLAERVPTHSSLADSSSISLAGASRCRSLTNSATCPSETELIKLYSPALASAKRATVSARLRTRRCLSDRPRDPSSTCATLLPRIHISSL